MAKSLAITVDTPLGARVFSVAQHPARDITVRRVFALCATGARMFSNRVYCDGGEVLVCAKGGFCLSFDGAEKVQLAAGEMTVVYPGNYLTIESLKSGGALNAVMLGGSGVDAFFNSFGFYDHMCAAVDVRGAAFKSLSKAFADNQENSELLISVGEMLTTYRHDIRDNGGAPLDDAIRAMHDCLDRGEAGIPSVCDRLKVSRSYLNALFVKRGLGAPGAFIRREQLRRACMMLRNTRLTVAEVARSVGISSPVYFSSCMRRRTGCTPREIRLGSKRTKNESEE